MKLTNLSLAILTAISLAACGGGGDDKPADPPKPTPDNNNNNNNQDKKPEQPPQAQNPVDPTQSWVVDNKDLTKDVTVGTLQYIRRDASQYDRALNPSQKASASPLLGEELNKQNPKLTNIVLARQHVTRAEGVAVQAQFAGMDNPEPLDREGNVNYDSVVENKGGLSLQEENFKNVDVLSQLYQKGNANSAKSISNSSDIGNDKHVDNLNDKIANNVDDKGKIHREPIANTKEDANPTLRTGLGEVYHYAYVRKDASGVYKRVKDHVSTLATAATDGPATVNGTNKVDNAASPTKYLGSVTGVVGVASGTGTNVPKDTLTTPSDQDVAKMGVYRKLKYKVGTADKERLGVVSDAKTVTAVIDPYAIDIDDGSNASDIKTVLAADEKNVNPLAGYKKITSKDVEGNKDVYMYRGSSLWKKPTDNVKQAVTPEFANSERGGTKYGKGLVWWTTPETAFENHFTRTGNLAITGSDSMPFGGNSATNGLVRIGGGLSTLGEELKYNHKESKWEDHHKTSTRIFGRYHLAYAGTAEKNKGVNPVAMNSYSGARSFAAEYESKAGGSYENPTIAQRQNRGTKNDQAGETTLYSLGAIPMTLKNVQYGRVTTQLDLDMGEKGYTDNFIRSPYRKKGEEDSVDNYFYRGTNATTIEQMAALPSDQKAVYKGHALMYGIDNSYHGGETRNLPNAFAGKTDGLGLGNFVEANADFGKKRVTGTVYNEWLLDQTKATTVKDHLVQFQGTITGNTVVGTADRKYVTGDDNAVFKASFFGEKAEEMGGSFNSVKDNQKYGSAYETADWGGVFGATRGETNTFQGDDSQNLYGGNRQNNYAP